MFPQEQYELWSASGVMLVGDATKTILAAPTGTRKRIVLTFLHLFSVVSAAQTVAIAIGTVSIADLPVSWAVGGEFFFGTLTKGLRGDAGSALVITPAAAGPRIHYVAEGYYET